MDTFLEICGPDFDVRGALRLSTLRQCAKTWRRADTFSSKIKHAFKDSGFSVRVGGGDDCGLRTQVADALDFLQKESNEIRLARMPVPDCEPPVESYPSGVVWERHYALNWLIGHCGQDWDDIPTDT